MFWIQWFDLAFVSSVLLHILAEIWIWAICLNMILFDICARKGNWFMKTGIINTEWYQHLFSKNQGQICQSGILTRRSKNAKEKGGKSSSKRICLPWLQHQDHLAPLWLILKTGATMYVCVHAHMCHRDLAPLCLHTAGSSKRKERWWH